MKSKRRTNGSVDDEEDDGFENSDVVIVKTKQRKEQSILISDFPEANPILRNLQVTSDLKFTHEAPKASAKYGLSLKELYKDRHLVYERAFEQPHITLDDQFLVKAVFKKNLKAIDFMVNVQEEVSGMTFDSNFDSGNLFRAYKVNDAEFDLILANDVNSSGYTNWFHFAIEVQESTPETLTFNCVNFVLQSHYTDR